MLPSASGLVKEAGMAWRSAVGIELDEAERCELEARRSAHLPSWATSLVS